MFIYFFFLICIPSPQADGAFEEGHLGSANGSLLDPAGPCDGHCIPGGLTGRNMHLINFVLVHSELMLLEQFVMNYLELVLLL